MRIGFGELIKRYKNIFFKYKWELRWSNEDDNTIIITKIDKYRVESRIHKFIS